jgi:hypothetical protein
VSGDPVVDDEQRALPHHHRLRHPAKLSVQRIRRTLRGRVLADAPRVWLVRPHAGADVRAGSGSAAGPARLDRLVGWDDQWSDLHTCLGLLRGRRLLFLENGRAMNLAVHDGGDDPSPLPRRLAGGRRRDLLIGSSESLLV